MRRANKTVKKKTIEKFENKIITGDVLKIMKQMPSNSVHLAIT